MTHDCKEDPCVLDFWAICVLASAAFLQLRRPLRGAQFHGILPAIGAPQTQPQGQCSAKSGRGHLDANSPYDRAGVR